MDETPPYPEFVALQAAARRASSMFWPNNLQRFQEVVRRRGSDWCTAVLGHEFSSLRTLSVRSCWLLVVADQANVEPPLPETVVEARTRAAAAQAEQSARADAARQRDTDRWEAAVRASAVGFEVRPNSHGRRTGAVYDTGPLLHAVPVADSVTGSGAKQRLHVAGRALCETPGRYRSRDLGAPVNGPATCVNCLKLAPHATPAR